MRRAPLLLAAVLAACSYSSTSDDPFFGDGYVVESRFPVEVDVGGDTLRVTVSYSGGCAEHEFQMRDRQSGGETEAWLEHDASGDTCEAYITRRLSISIEDRADLPDVLLTPSGERRPVYYPLTRSASGPPPVSIPERRR